jgi:hypothetical protein
VTSRCAALGALVAVALALVAAAGTQASPNWPPGIPWERSGEDMFAPERVGIVRKPKSFPKVAREELYRAYSEIYWLGRARDKEVVDMVQGLFDPVNAALIACGGGGAAALKEIEELKNAYALYSKAKDSVAALNLFEKQAQLERNERYVQYLWYWLGRYNAGTKTWNAKSNLNGWAYTSTQKWFKAKRQAVYAAATNKKGELCLIPGKYSMFGTITLTNVWSPSAQTAPNDQFSLTGTCTATLTFNGTDTVKVDMKLTYTEKLVTTYSGGELVRLTQEWQNDGTFKGTIYGTSTIAFGRGGTYVVTYPTPQKKMTVESEQKETREYRNNPTKVEPDHDSWQDSCWFRYSASRATGATSTRVAASKAVEHHDLGPRRLVSTLTWNLQAAGRRR